jgi:hypothetical protein
MQVLWDQGEATTAGVRDVSREELARLKALIRQKERLGCLGTFTGFTPPAPCRWI